MADMLVVKIADKNKSCETRNWIPTELSDEQNKVIRPPFPNEKIITGPAGSGKTVLAVYFYRALVDSGVDIVVFGKILSSFITFNLNQEVIPVDSIFHFVKELTSITVGNGDYESAANKASKWSIKNSNIRNNLIVDEAQDFHKGHLLFCSNISSRIIVFADSAQKMFTHGKSVNVIKGLIKENRNVEFDEVKIKGNYRNQVPVAEFAQPFYYFRDKVFPSAPQVGARENVKLFKCENIQYLKDAFVEESIRIVKSQPNHTPTIGILVQSNSRINKVRRWFREKGYDSLIFQKDYDFSSNHPIVMNMQSAKGLEFDYVIIVDLNYSSLKRLHKDDCDNIVFVALTRARRSISMFLIDDENNKSFFDKIKNTNFETINLGG